VPKASVESAGEDYWEMPIGSGPFKVKEWLRGERLVLERNDFYWDQPKPYLDEVVIELVPDDNTRMLKFTANEVDIALNVPYTQIESIDALDGASVQVVPILASQMVHLNAGAPPLDDLNARKALQHATDRQALIDAVLFGYGDIATMLWPQGLLYWDDSVEGYPYDLDKAREFLSQSAYPEGFDLTLYHASGDTPAEQTATLLKDQWAEIGVNVTIEPLEGTLQIDETLGGNFETSIVYWSSDIIDPSQLNISHLCALTEGMVGGCNDDFDAAAAEADTLVDESARAAAYADLFRIAEDWSIYIPLYYFPSRTAVYDYVKDFQLTPTVFPRYWEVWLDR
ncbi:MAG: ABC transporter substrate-binding protein, partial [Anaerolineales bacterium]|nr:ABC transporter substrate-binding protein [Anaerolineales bacterium]